MYHQTQVQGGVHRQNREKYTCEMDLKPTRLRYCQTNKNNMASIFFFMAQKLFSNSSQQPQALPIHLEEIKADILQEQRLLSEVLSP